MHRRLAIAPLLSLLVAAAPTTAPHAPTSIAAPEGCRLVVSLRTSGVQVYKAVTTPTGLGWKLDGPLATLTDSTGVEAYHYDGPTWEDIDGSRVVRDPAVAVRSTPSPRGDGDILWLLVKVQADGDAPGRLAPVTYVQRTDTAGGAAPSAPPRRIGTKVAVPYSATYRFYAATR